MASDTSAEVSALGPVVREYPLDASKATWVRVASYALAALGVAAVVAALVRLSARLSILAGVLFVSGFLSLVLSARTLVALRRRATRSVALVRDGLVILSEGQARAVPWHQVIQVRQDVGMSTRGAPTSDRLSALEVETLNGAVHRFDGFTEGLDHLSELVQLETTHQLQEAFDASIQRGEAVRFGEIMVDQRGLWHGDKQLVWQDFRGISLRGQRVMVRAAGQEAPWLSLPIMQVPNALLLLRLVRSVATGQVPPEREPEQASPVEATLDTAPDA
jgi:hypothetical protein